MKIKIFLLLLICIMACCKKENNVSQNIDQKIIFQLEYINYAWIDQHTGWLMDSSGNIRGYKLPPKWNFIDSAGYISSYHMSENIQQLDTILCRIEKDTLQKYFNKLIRAAMGEITQPKSEMFDAGSTMFCGYIFDSNSKKYKQILLKQIGDVFIENKSTEANEIYNWMIRINKKE